MQPLGSIINGSEDGKPESQGSDSSGSASVESGTNSTEGRISEPERIGGIPAFAPSYPITGTESTGPKRRGRPPGSRNRTAGNTPIASATFTRAEAPQDLTKSSIADLEALLLSIHLMGAKLLSTPELELDEIEAKKLSDAIKNVAKHYPVVISAKKIALFDLAATVGGIYGTRIVAIVAGKKKQRPAIVQDISQPKQTPQPQSSPAPPSTAPRPLNPHEVIGLGNAGGENY